MQVVDINGATRECISAYPDKQWPGYIRVEFANKKRKHTEWYPSDDFKKNNPNLGLINDAVPYIAKEISGIVTRVGENTLTDNTQSWEENEYVGFPLWISRGKGEGQVRTVILNTKKTLTLDKSWDILPNTFSQYVLSHNVNPLAHPLGNTTYEQDQHSLEKKAKAMDRKVKRAQQKAINLTLS